MAWNFTTKIVFGLTDLRKLKLLFKQKTDHRRLPLGPSQTCRAFPGLEQQVLKILASCEGKSCCLVKWCSWSSGCTWIRALSSSTTCNRCISVINAPVKHTISSCSHQGGVCLTLQ